MHITRRENRWAEDGQDIGPAEWDVAVAADSALAAVPTWWTAGRIVSKNPSDAVIATMCRVAKALNARVQGDAGEYYDA